MSPSAPPPTFNGFAIAREAWDLLIGNRDVMMLALIVAAILFILPPVLALAVAVIALPFVLAATLYEPSMPFVLGAVLFVGFVGGFMVVAVGALAAQISTAARAASGQAAEVDEALRIGARLAPRAALVAFFVGVIVFIGFLALIVPGFFAIACFFVAVPAAVLEGRGLGDSVNRSVALTSGYRWRLFSAWFGIALVVSIGAGMVEAILGALGFGLTFLLLQFAFFFAWNAWNANYMALAFLRLREIKG